MSDRTRDSRLVDLAGLVNVETAKAYLFHDGIHDAVWLPKSQVEFDDGVMTLPEWLAIEKGLI